MLMSLKNLGPDLSVKGRERERERFKIERELLIRLLGRFTEDQSEDEVEIHETFMV